MRSSEKQRCGTPSTEANFSLVSSSDSYLPELLQIMYIENYTYQDLIQYFTWTFTQLDSFDSFRQQVYQATKLYMKKIALTIKEDFYYNDHYPEIIRLLYKTYQNVHEKHKEVQLLSDAFADHDLTDQTIFAEELFHRLFIQEVLEEHKIKDFFEYTLKMFESKFNQKAYRQTLKKVQFFNKLLTSKRKPLTKPYTRKNTVRASQQISGSPGSTGSTGSTEADPQLDEDTNKYQKSTKRDEIKIFEQQLDQIYADTYSVEQTPLELPSAWLQSIKQKQKKLLSNQ